MALPMPAARAGRLVRKPTTRGGRVNPFRIHQFQTGKVASIPDIIEWTVSDKYLNRPNLYPRQATFLKIIFLQDDLFTQFDYDVIGEWEERFQQTGTEGLNPGILDRIRINKANGRPWFRETQAVWGRRGSKGYIGALAGSYVLWHFMHRPGGPQNYYGIDRDKRLTGIVFAGKKEQAAANQWRDLNNIIIGGPCFAPYISRAQTERLTIYAPTDILRYERQLAAGIESEIDLATFEVIPAPSTTMAARGPASFCLDPETPVLTADLRWVPIKDLSVGDEVVGLDENPECPGAQRKMRRAQVLATSWTKKPALRLTFEDGTSVVCSEDHRWLTKELGKGGASKWRYANTLKPGNKIKWIVDPWEEERSAEAGYLKGFFDGEGCVSGWSGRSGKSVYFSQNEGPVLDHVLALLNDRDYHLDLNTHQSPVCRQWMITGSAQAMRFLGSIRPIRLMNNAASVWEGVAPRGGNNGTRERPESAKIIVLIERLPEQDLVDIQTTTHTFLANGLVSHNCQMYDEQAHVINSTSNADAEQVYASATPSLDQFKKDGFIYAPSSPWAKTGQFFTNWELAIEMEPDGSPTYPERLMLQLPSWGPYEDWDEAHRIPMRPPVQVGVIETKTEVKKRKTIKGKRRTVTEIEVKTIPKFEPDEIGPFKRLKGAIQEFDDDMRQLQRANPETFKVERLAQWAESLDAYLNPIMVERIFKPWNGEMLFIQNSGVLSQTYIAHGDPANTNKRFGWSMAHRVWVPKIDEETGKEDGGAWHVVFDRIRCWEPADYPDHTLDYDDVMGDIWEQDVKKFYPEDVSFDQFNVPATIGWLRKKIAKEQLPKGIVVHEVTRTRPLNWRHFELFKAAINMGLVHAPMHLLEKDESGEWKVNYASSEVENELKFLEEKNGVVDHPSSGPVQTKDIADTMVEVVVHLIGKQLATFLGQEFDDVGLSGSAPLGTDPGRHTRTQADDMGDRLTGSTSAVRRGMAARSAPSRSGMRRR